MRRRRGEVGDIGDKGELVYKLVFAPIGRSVKPAKTVYHQAGNAGTHPDIAIDDPQYITLGFPVCSAHVADLRIRTQVVYAAIMPAEVGVFILHEDLRIKGRKVGDEALEKWEGRIIAGRDAKAYCQLLGGIGLVEGCSEAFVEVWFHALDGPDDGDMRNINEWKCWCYGLFEGFRVVPLPGSS